MKKLNVRGTTGVEQQGFPASVCDVGKADRFSMSLRLWELGEKICSKNFNIYTDVGIQFNNTQK